MIGPAATRAVLAGVLCAIAIHANAAEVWTLETTVQRMLAVSPEARSAEAEIAAREADLSRDTAWPNPTVEARADEKLGLEDGRGGVDVTQLAITQPLPIRRLSRQRRQGEAAVKAAREARRYRALLLENEAAHLFFRLQLAREKQRLAGERFTMTSRYAERRRRGGIVRYLSPLERTRLSLLHESAHQNLVTAEGEWREAAAQIRALLVLPDSDPLAMASLATVPPPEPLAELESRLDRQPALVAAQREVEAAQLGIDVARASRFADPTVTLFRERDILGGSRRDFNGVVLGVQIPLWNRGSGAVDRAAAEANKAAAAHDARRRELVSALRESHLRLTRLVAQADRYAKTVVEPSRKFLDLTRRGFESGEFNVLTLIDANETYFAAAQRHLELLAEAAAVAADLRLAVGESIAEEVRP